MSQTTLELIKAIREGHKDDVDFLFRKKMVESIKPKLEEIKKRVGKEFMKEKSND